MGFELDQSGTVGIADPKVFVSARISWTLPTTVNTIEIQSGLLKPFPPS
jgi:hypothetical protein